ncbi:MAG: hypothetical protein KBS52_00810 [Clostridiales bacterium]|nr:hypothetical protein [Candidatus Equinaster intestinalis]
MTNRLFGKHRNLIITCIALVLILVIIIVAAVIAGSKEKTNPVASDSVTVTIETEPTAYFNLSTSGYIVNGVTVENKTDADLISNITTLVPFKQSALAYVKNLIEAKKIGGDANNIVLLAVESRNEADFDQLSAQFKETLKEAGSDAQVYCMYIKVKSEDLEQLAKENNASYAKAYLCRKIAEQSDDLDEAKLIKLSITEIINSLVKTSSGKQPQEIIDDANKEQKEIKIEEKEEDDDDNSNTTADITSTESNPSTSTAVSGNEPSTDVSATPSETPSTSTSDAPSKPESTVSRNSVSYVVSNDDSGWLPGLW